MSVPLLHRPSALPVSLLPLLSNRICQAWCCQEISFFLPYWEEELKNIRHLIKLHTFYWIQILASEYQGPVLAIGLSHMISDWNGLNLLTVQALVAQWMEQDVRIQGDANTSFNRISVLFSSPQVLFLKFKSSRSGIKAIFAMVVKRISETCTVSSSLC